jgi:hypothetical protein
MTNTLNAPAFLADLTVGVFYNFRTANGDSHMGSFERFDAAHNEVVVGWASTWYAGDTQPTELDGDHDAVLLDVDQITEVFDDEGNQVH